MRLEILDKLRKGESRRSVCEVENPQAIGRGARYMNDILKEHSEPTIERCRKTDGGWIQPRYYEGRFHTSGREREAYHRLGDSPHISLARYTSHDVLDVFAISSAEKWKYCALMSLPATRNNMSLEWDVQGRNTSGRTVALAVFAEGIG
jgi:hypothetical protein